MATSTAKRVNLPQVCMLPTTGCYKGWMEGNLISLSTLRVTINSILGFGSSESNFLCHQSLDSPTKLWTVHIQSWSCWPCERANKWNAVFVVDWNSANQKQTWIVCCWVFLCTITSVAVLSSFSDTSWFDVKSFDCHTVPICMHVFVCSCACATLVNSTIDI